jgi:hypothetical protein
MYKSVNIEDLHKINFDLAEEIKLIRLMMVGKGISPADSPLVQSRMHEIESKLRMIGADPNNIIPFEVD